MMNAADIAALLADATPDTIVHIDYLAGRPANVELEVTLPVGRRVKFARNGQVKHPTSGDFLGFEYSYTDPDHETGSDARLTVYND